MSPGMPPSKFKSNISDEKRRGKKKLGSCVMSSMAKDKAIQKRIGIS